MDKTNALLEPTESIKIFFLTQTILPPKSHFFWYRKYANRMVEYCRDGFQLVDATVVVVFLVRLEYEAIVPRVVAPLLLVLQLAQRLQQLQHSQRVLLDAGAWVSFFLHLAAAVVVVEKQTRAQPALGRVAEEV